MWKSAPIACSAFLMSTIRLANANNFWPYVTIERFSMNESGKLNGKLCSCSRARGPTGTCDGQRVPRIGRMVSAEITTITNPTGHTSP